MSIANEIQRLQSAKANIKTAIENKGVTVGDATIDTYAAKIDEISIGGSGDYDQGYEDGKQAEYNAFWDAFQDYGNRKNYRRGFYDFGYGWDDETYNPKYPIIFSANESYSANDTFYNSAITDTKVAIICEGAAQLASTFYGAKRLKTIRKIVINENVKNSNAFYNCIALENIFFEGVVGASISFLYSPLLTNNSVQNIIDCLADLTGGTAQTLTLHTTVGAKLTDEQKATITAKNWTLVY